jgi:predicted RNase H-like HicB family nuclease
MLSSQNALYRVFRTLFPHQDPVLIKRKYGIPDKINLNVRITPNGWFVATSAELHGLVTQAKDQEELMAMVNDAVLTYFDVPKKEADIIYDQFNFGSQTIQYSGQC